MGSVVGEQLVRGFERAAEEKLPVVIFSGGGGGACMQGIYSLMQMAKPPRLVGTAAGLLYISVLTHPTMGGIYASFASLGDIILAEPGALIGFAENCGRDDAAKLLPGSNGRVCPEHGMIDAIVPRTQLLD